MLRTFRSRRRHRYGIHLCATVSALLLLFSVALLHTRLGIDRYQSHSTFSSKVLQSLDADPLFEDAISDFSTSEERIDAQDIIEEISGSDASILNEEDILTGVVKEDGNTTSRSRVSRFKFDHVIGVLRRPFDRRSIDNWEDYASFGDVSRAEDPSKGEFASDDFAVDLEVRRKFSEVDSIEDALLLKTNGRINSLKDGWGRWFDKKGDFLRRDKMFKSNMDILDPWNHPLLQDPDGVGLTGLTRNDKLVQEFLVKESIRMPLSVEKPLKLGDKVFIDFGTMNAGDEDVEVNEFGTDVSRSKIEIQKG